MPLKMVLHFMNCHVNLCFSVIEITEADLIVNTGIALSFRLALENIKEKMIAIDRNMNLPRMSPFYYLGMVISGNEVVRIPLGDVLGKFYIGKGSFTNYVYRFLAFLTPPLSFGSQLYLIKFAKFI